MTRRWLPLLLTMAVFGPARATDHPQDAVKLILTENHFTGKAKAVWVSQNPPPVLPALSPTSVGGAFVVTGIWPPQQVSTPLPAGDWKPNPAGTLYKFVNKLAPSGSSAVKVALVKDGRVLKVVAKDNLIYLGDLEWGPVAVALTIGDDTYCSVCQLVSMSKWMRGRWVARKCSAPADCSAAVPTTTTTTSPTTTTMPCVWLPAGGCFGECAPGASCALTGFKSCSCVVPGACELGPFPTCGGTCASGLSCYPYRDPAGLSWCGCAPTAVPCNGTSLPCGGIACPSGEVCDITFSGCGCTLP